MKKLAMLIVILLAAAALAAGSVKLFQEPGGGPGKIHPVTAKDLRPALMDEFFYTENYFLIAITDSGYYGYVSILISNLGTSKHTPAVSFTVVTPDKKRLTRDVDFSAEDLKIGTGKFSLTLKDNWLRETADGYEVKVEDSGLGVNLKYVNEVPGFKLGDGAAMLGEHRFVIHYPGPRPKVTGHFLVDGKKIPVSGWGYMDHSVSSTNPSDFEDVWHNLKFRSDDYTILISSFTTPPEIGGDFAVAVVTDREKVICSSTNVRAREKNAKPDPVSGKNYPAEVSYEIIGEGCSARASMNVSDPSEKFDVLSKLDKSIWTRAAKTVINTFIAEPWYYRAVGPVEAEIEIGGVRQTVKGQAFSEIIYTK